MKTRIRNTPTKKNTFNILAVVFLFSLSLFLLGVFVLIIIFPQNFILLLYILGILLWGNISYRVTKYLSKKIYQKQLLPEEIKQSFGSLERNENFQHHHNFINNNTLKTSYNHQVLLLYLTMSLLWSNIGTLIIILAGLSEDGSISIKGVLILLITLFCIGIVISILKYIIEVRPKKIDIYTLNQRSKSNYYENNNTVFFY